MKLLQVNLPNDHNLIFYGDVHDGSQLTSNTGWGNLCDLIYSEYDGCSNNWAAEGGDAIEAIMVDDKRFSTEQLRNQVDEDGESLSLPLAQLNYAVKKREPIKGKILYMLDGNHENGLRRMGNITKSLSKQLNSTYGTYTTKLTVRDEDGKIMYKVFDTHGRKSISSCADDPIRRKTNMNLILKRHLKYQASDCAVMIKHHVHKLLVCRPEHELCLTDDGKKIKQSYTKLQQTGNEIPPDLRYYGCAGSFLKLYGDGYSGYAEIAEYPPTELGFLILKVRDKQIVDLEPYYIKL